MAKARWIKPEFFTDAKVSLVSDQAALLFAALWTESDDGGVVPGDPRVIYGRCFITRTGWTVLTVEKCLQELSASGLIALGNHQDQQWVLIPNLMKNQGMPPKKWRYLGETTHDQITQQIFSENQRKSTFTPKPYPEPKPKAVANTPLPPADAPSALVGVHTNGKRSNGKSGLPVRYQDITARLASVMSEVEAGGRKALNQDQARELQADMVFAYWAAKLNHEGAMLDGKRLNRLTDRLRENGGNVHELLFCVDGARKDPHLMGQNQTSTKYDGIETIFRERAQVEKLSVLGGYKEGKEHPLAQKYAAAMQ